MTKQLQEFRLEEILEICTNRSSSLYEKACSLFIHRYKNYIYKIVYQRCSLWYQNHKPCEMSELVNDIVNDIFLLLFKCNARALHTFKATHSETAFRCYLATISDRMARRTLQRKVINASLDEMLDIKDQGLSEDQKWQVFDYIVTMLRSRAGKQERYVERNILIYNLYTLEDFTKEMLNSPPMFHNLGHRVVDNVVGRSREKLSREDENNLRELLFE